MTLVDALSRPQVIVLSEINERIRRYRPTAIPALVDEDVRDAASAMAATLETAARGIVYEHHPASLPAQRVLSLFRQLEADMAARAPVPHGVLALVFRRLEEGCRHAAEKVGGAEAAYLDLLDRLGAARSEETRTGDVGPAERDADAPRIIVPGA
jgi:hypothetical protein